MYVVLALHRVNQDTESLKRLTFTFGLRYVITRKNFNFHML